MEFWLKFSDLWSWSQNWGGGEQRKNHGMA